MAGSVKLVGKEIWTDLDGIPKERPFSKLVTASNGAEERSYTVANSGVQTVWDPTNDGSETGSTFVYFRVTSDQNIHLLLVTDVAADIGVVYKTMEVVAGVPFLLGSDTSYANPSSNAFTGTLDVTDQIRVQNLSGNSAIVSVLIGT